MAAAPQPPEQPSPQPRAGELRIEEPSREPHGRELGSDELGNWKLETGDAGVAELRSAGAGKPVGELRSGDPDRLYSDFY